MEIVACFHDPRQQFGWEFKYVRMDIERGLYNGLLADRLQAQARVEEIAFPMCGPFSSPALYAWRGIDDEKDIPSGERMTNE